MSEWSETLTGGFQAGRWGGTFDGSATDLAAASPPLFDPTLGFINSGFRVASPIPEPTTGLLLGLGLMGFARLLLLVRHTDTLLGVTDPGLCL